METEKYDLEERSKRQDYDVRLLSMTIIFFNSLKESNLFVTSSLFHDFIPLFKKKKELIIIASAVGMLSVCVLTIAKLGLLFLFLVIIVGYYC